MANRKAAAARLPAVHPRVCGERRSHMAANLYATGSSPRVRGTHAYAPDDDSALRFIPACAGNAAHTWPRTCTQPVHPRVCGERTPTRPTTTAPSGSSPRVRGTPFHGTRDIHSGRFIPACAGNADDQAGRTRDSPVHPRVCGERVLRKYAIPGSHGSSPRVRGTPAARGRRGERRRFIPACAGNARPS